MLSGMMVDHSRRALDYLVARDDVDARRLGTSTGSTMAWWPVALDDRLNVTVGMNGLSDFEALLDDKGLSRPGVC